MKKLVAICMVIYTTLTLYFFNAGIAEFMFDNSQLESMKKVYIGLALMLVSQPLLLLIFAYFISKNSKEKKSDAIFRKYFWINLFLCLLTLIYCAELPLIEQNYCMKECS